MFPTIAIVQIFKVQFLPDLIYLTSLTCKLCLSHIIRTELYLSTVLNVKIAFIVDNLQYCMIIEGVLIIPVISIRVVLVQSLHVMCYCNSLTIYAPEFLNVWPALMLSFIENCIYFTILECKSGPQSLT